MSDVFDSEAGWIDFIFTGGVLHAGAQNDSLADRPALQLIWHK